MSFWSGEKLAKVLPKLIYPYVPQNIDCASYHLRLGDQAFVTQDEIIDGKPNATLIQELKDTPTQKTLIIGTGQFAFLLTEEKVTIPKDAIAFISMRSKYKNKGLINVSGFHVDPGFSGKLTFAVYNAGPRELILTKGDRLFMLVYADLDQDTEKYFYTGSSQNQNSIRTDSINELSGQVFSPKMLQREMDKLKEKQIELDKEFGKIATKQEYFRFFFFTLFGLLLTLTIAITKTDTFEVFIGGVLNRYIKIYQDNLVKQDALNATSPESCINNSITINHNSKSSKVDCARKAQ